MNDKKVTITIHVGIIAIITFVVFCLWKLVGAITWSWWWVTAPLWIPLALCLLACIGILVGYVIYKIREYIKAKRRYRA